MKLCSLYCSFGVARLLCCWLAVARLCCWLAVALRCRWLAISAVLLLFSSVGCQQRAASKLQGRWEGRPDTSAARAKRESERFAKTTVDLTGHDSTGHVSGDKVSVGQELAGQKRADQNRVGGASDLAQLTDWENYDVTILIDFVSSERLEMSLVGGKQPQSGSWKVVSTSPAGCAIEVQTEAEGANGEKPTRVRRRFELLLDERDGTCVGFLLTETGADRQQGAIYFQRPRSAGMAQSN